MSPFNFNTTDSAHLKLKYNTIKVAIFLVTTMHAVEVTVKTGFLTIDYTSNLFYASMVLIYISEHFVIYICTSGHKELLCDTMTVSFNQSNVI